MLHIKEAGTEILQKNICRFLSSFTFLRLLDFSNTSTPTGKKRLKEKISVINYWLIKRYSHLQNVRYRQMVVRIILNCEFETISKKKKNLILSQKKTRYSGTGFEPKYSNKYW